MIDSNALIVAKFPERLLVKMTDAHAQGMKSTKNYSPKNKKWKVQIGIHTNSTWYTGRGWYAAYPTD